MSAPVEPTSADRLLVALRALIRAELPQLTYFGVYDYSIQSASGSTVDVTPNDTTQPLPAMSGVPLIPSLVGQVVVPNSGTCRIRFVNGDPTRPVCVGIQSTPSTSTVDATGQLNIGPSAATVQLKP